MDLRLTSLATKATSFMENRGGFVSMMDNGVENTLSASVSLITSNYSTHWVLYCHPNSAIRCPELDIEYGKVKVTGYTPGSKAVYYCNPYHKLVGDVTRKCLYDGTWSDEEPTCKSMLQSNHHCLVCMTFTYCHARPYFRDPVPHR